MPDSYFIITAAGGCGWTSGLTTTSTKTPLILFMISFEFLVFFGSRIFSPFHLPSKVRKWEEEGDISANIKAVS